MRGRKPLPVALKLVTGNPGKRPLNLTEPRSGELKGPPRHLTEAERSAWRELVRAAPPHVLQQGDRFILETTARLLVRLRGEVAPSNTSVTAFKALLSELGLTPSSRSRLSVAPPVPVNPFKDLA
ncbi:MAG: hypothetical protein U1E17_25225 [Geminicoccaceae bacterium]